MTTPEPRRSSADLAALAAEHERVADEAWSEYIHHTDRARFYRSREAQEARHESRVATVGVALRSRP